MAKARNRLILVLLGLATVLAGCTSGPVIDALPSAVGLPADAPARPAKSYEYPAVHDMPPARTAPTMTEEQQLKLEKELAADRDRQEVHEEPAKKTAKPAQKKPARKKDAEAAGAKANP